MSDVSILDCTLRDGGYINDWAFNTDTSRKIVKSLVKANIEYIELGYINDISGKSINSTLFKNINDTNNLIADSHKKYVVMVNLGDCNIDNIEYNSNIYGIRLAFHKNKWVEALEEAKKIINKGYKVFIQPMVTVSYSEAELCELIYECNKLNIYALYIVDSFGVMKPKDALRLAFIVDKNLRKDIKLGIHCHNNLQLAYSNSVKVIKNLYNRELIVDSSVFGMGRGAGNLNTELMVDCLIQNLNKNYYIEPLLDIIDDCLINFYRKNYWGYSVAYYISAIYNCHPNYSLHLIDKKKLTVKNIENIMKSIDNTKKYNFDKEYIEKLYLDFNSKQDTLSYYDQLKYRFQNKKIILIDPGKNVEKYKRYLLKYMDESSLTVSINHASEIFESDYIFFNNEKRYLQYKTQEATQTKYGDKVIISSNLSFKEKFVVNYSDLLGKTDESRDNATIMFLNLLVSFGIGDVYVAGFDGYDYSMNSYVLDEMELDYTREKIDSINNSIKMELINIMDKINIEFLTPSKFNYVQELV